jgi:hypothetical protein
MSEYTGESSNNARSGVNGNVDAVEESDEALVRKPAQQKVEKKQRSTRRTGI